MKLVCIVFLWFAALGVHAQCDSLFAEPNFGVENKWMPITKEYAEKVDFQSVCLARSNCYLDGNSLRKHCDAKYHEGLSKVCTVGYQFHKRQFGQCMRKVNDAARLVELEGAQYYRSQKRKVEAKKRETERKARAASRREGYLDRAAQRKKKRMGR